MTPPMWDLGIVPCTSGKNPGGLTPLTLYRGAIFSVHMRHALQRCRDVWIMSAKYGLIPMDAPVAYYNAYLPDLSPGEIERLLARITFQARDPRLAQAQRVLSYLPRAYHEALMLAAPDLGSHCKRPYAIRSLTQVKTLSNEIQNYGTHPSRR